MAGEIERERESKREREKDRKGFTNHRGGGLLITEDWKYTPWSEIKRGEFLRGVLQDQLKEMRTLTIKEIAQMHKLKWETNPMKVEIDREKMDREINPMKVKIDREKMDREIRRD